MSGTSEIVREIYYEALAIEDPKRRESYLAAVCEDTDLRLRIQSLLDADSDGVGFLEETPIKSLLNPDPTDDIGITESVGSTIGDFKLLEQIGEGGFGVVFMAEQTRPIERRVAIKIVKPGMDSKQVLARFEAERQALALMDHPNIAKILEAGTTESGRPYFIMELVRGVPVTEFCDDRCFSLTQRLELFTEICSAIQHAHQKGIIHRDIKPSNILVGSYGDRPVAKVIDFGIAKATQGRLTDKTLFTHFRQFVGTPAYMSPEQAQMSAVDVDTRSDIYALGVLLYELLTGKTPLDPDELKQAGIDEVCRRIREEDPLAPSKRVSSLSHEDRSSLSKTRCATPESLGLSIRNDLDWIVMKAVEKERRHRYSTAEALSEDVQRFLNGEPVLAAPPNSFYQFRKFARRHRRIAIPLVAVVGAILLTGTVGVYSAVRLAAEGQVKNQAIEQMSLATEIAEKEKLNSDRLRYCSDMYSASLALQLHDIGLAGSYLRRYQNSDLRGWEWQILNSLARPDAIQREGTDGMTHLCAIRNRKMLATISNAGLALWRVDDGGQLVKTKERPLTNCQIVDIKSADARLYAVTSEGELRQWTIPKLEEQECNVELGSDIHCFDVSPDGSLLAVSSGKTKLVTLWRMKSQAPPQRFREIDTKWYRRHVAFSPDGRMLAIGKNSSVHIIDTASAREIHTANVGGKYAIAFSPDGKLLATSPAFQSRHINILRFDSRAEGESAGATQLQLVGQLHGHGGVIDDLTFSQDSKSLASASGDTTIRVWDVDELQVKYVLQGHADVATSVEFVEGDSNSLVSSGKRDVCLFDLCAKEGRLPIEKKLVATETMSEHGVDYWERQYSQASFSHNTDWLVTRNRNPKFTCSLRSPDTLEEVTLLRRLGSRIRGVRFSPTSNLLAVGDFDGKLHFLSRPETDEVATHSFDGVGRVSPVQYSADGSRLLIVVQQYEKAKFVVWSIEEMRELTSWTIEGVDTCASISPDGRVVATGHEDGNVRLYSIDNASNATQSRQITVEQLPSCLAFSPSGKRLVIGGQELHLVDLHNTNSVVKLPSSTSIFSVCFSPDGHRIAAGGAHENHAVTIWDTATCTPVAKLPTGGYSFVQTEFSPDGASLMAIGGGGWLKIWSAKATGS